MNITKIHNSILPTYDKSGYNNKNLSTELLFFSVVIINKIDIKKWGPILENYKIFPNKTNVEFVQVINRKHLRMRVWERGAGITLACGTGACATLTAAVLNNLSERKAKLELDGGDLSIEWNASDNNIYMTGPATKVFEGIYSE